MRDLNIRSGTAFILMFDLTVEKSLNNLIDLHQNIVKIKGTESIALVLVGNKLDLIIEDDLIINKAKKLASDIFKCPFIETSAKLSSQEEITKVFLKLADIVSREFEENPEIFTDNQRRSSSLSFAPRVTINIDNNRSEHRRFSEPCADKNKIVNPKKQKKTSNTNSRKSSNKDCSTPNSRRKHKNCTIQ